MKSRVASTGYEFASEADLDRDEFFARYIGARDLLIRILLERQHRRWTDDQRKQFFGLYERWYEI